MIPEDENEPSDDNIVPTDEIASQTVDELESELLKFRIEWKRELLIQDKNAEFEQSTAQSTQGSNTNQSSKTKSKNIAVYHEFPQRARPDLKNTTKNDLGIEKSDTADLDYEQPKTNEEKARYLFDKGEILEQQGRHYEGSI